jgi:membrane protein implicated in regulation of membrane protease activity
VIRKALALFAGFALLNLALFVICFFWLEITQFLSTDVGIYFLLFMALALATPALYRIHVRRKEAALKKQEHATLRRRRVESEIEHKDIGIDF